MAGLTAQYRRGEGPVEGGGVPVIKEAYCSDQAGLNATNWTEVLLED